MPFLMKVKKIIFSLRKITLKPLNQLKYLLLDILNIVKPIRLIEYLIHNQRTETIMMKTMILDHFHLMDQIHLFINLQTVLQLGKVQSKVKFLQKLFRKVEKCLILLKQWKKV